MGTKLLEPLGRGTLHLCVDCQLMFAEETDWHMPWMQRVLPVVRQLAEAHPAETIFTRFIPVTDPEAARGRWRRYYHRWESMTLDRLDPAMIELVPQLQRLVPPAETFDKHFYSPWIEAGLQNRLRERRIDTLVVTGGETDVCVLATVLGAIDLGYRIVLATDALCSSSDEAHDSSLNVFEQRFGQQVETVTTETILGAWRINAE